MNGKQNITNLLSVLRVRESRAQLAIVDQQKVVEQARRSLVTAQAAVANLNRQLDENRDYRLQNTVQADPAKICAAISHRKQLDYEMERESYYESLAEEELKDQLLRLKQCRQALEKIKTKLETAENLRKKQIARVDYIRQDALEEETVNLMRQGAWL